MKPSTDDVLKWAREARMYWDEKEQYIDCSVTRYDLERYATLAYAAGAAAMKERAAKVCEGIAAYYSTDIFPEDGTSIDCNSAKMGRVVTKNCAQTIRALGDDDE